MIYTKRVGWRGSSMRRVGSCTRSHIGSWSNYWARSMSTCYSKSEDREGSVSALRRWSSSCNR